jgi:hypothetical protein
MILWYDKQGKPLLDAEDIKDPRWIEQMREVEKLLTDREYKVVGQDYTPNKKYWVSTVWLGIDHSFSWFKDEPNPHPLIFETMVFYSKPAYKYHTVKGKRKRWYYHESVNDDDYEGQDRYVSEEGAKLGHQRWLKHFTDREKEELANGKKLKTKDDA